MKFDQSVAYYVRNIFLQKSCGKWGREATSGPLLFFEKVLFELVCTLVSIYFDSPLLRATMNEMYETLDC